MITWREGIWNQWKIGNTKLEVICLQFVCSFATHSAICLEWSGNWDVIW